MFGFGLVVCGYGCFSCSVAGFGAGGCFLFWCFLFTFWFPVYCGSVAWLLVVWVGLLGFICLGFTVVVAPGWSFLLMFCVGIAVVSWYGAGIIVNSVVIVRNTFYFECSRFTCNLLVGFWFGLLWVWCFWCLWRVGCCDSFVLFWFILFALIRWFSGACGWFLADGLLGFGVVICSVVALVVGAFWWGVRWFWFSGFDCYAMSLVGLDLVWR